MAQDYNSTLNLPKTEFAMRAGLPQKEPGYIATWEENRYYEEQLKKNEGKPTYILHDGPPYANGDIHLGTALNKVLKDIIVKHKNMSGYHSYYVPGWDTHGLPVELGVEKMLGITKEDIGTKITVEEYNDACRKEVMKYTAEWVNMTERVGYWVDMNDPYITYDNRYIETLWHLLQKIYTRAFSIRVSLSSHILQQQVLVSVLMNSISLAAIAM